MERAISALFDLETRQRGTQILIAVMLYKKAQGRWPASLSDPRLGIDRIRRKDPRSGEDFVYRAKDDSMTLYSVGRDGQDNGSDPASDDIVLWPPQ